MTEQYAELRGRLVVGRKSDGRGVYDEGAKRELIVACLKQGVSVARMAMEHGVNTNLLRTWIAAYQRRSALVSAGDVARAQDAAFVAVQETPAIARVPLALCSLSCTAAAEPVSCRLSRSERCHRMRAKGSTVVPPSCPGARTPNAHQRLASVRLAAQGGAADRS